MVAVLLFFQFKFIGVSSELILLSVANDINVSEGKYIDTIQIIKNKVIIFLDIFLTFFIIISFHNFTKVNLFH